MSDAGVANTGKLNCSRRSCALQSSHNCIQTSNNKYACLTLTSLCGVLYCKLLSKYDFVRVDGSKAGMNAENVKAAGRAVKNQLSVEEAQMILGVDSKATWEEIMKKYRHLYDANEKNGSFYLLSKVYRAHERLKEEYPDAKEEGAPGGQSSEGGNA